MVECENILWPEELGSELWMVAVWMLSEATKCFCQWLWGQFCWSYHLDLWLFFPSKSKLSHWYCGWHLEDKILFKAAKWAFLKIRLFLVLVVVCPLFHQQRYCFPHICQQWPLRCLFLSDAFTTTARGVFGGQVSAEVVEALTWWRKMLMCRLASGRGNSFK